MYLLSRARLTYMFCDTFSADFFWSHYLSVFLEKVDTTGLLGYPMVSNTPNNPPFLINSSCRTAETESCTRKIKSWKESLFAHYVRLAHDKAPIYSRYARDTHVIEENLAKRLRSRYCI